MTEPIKQQFRPIEFACVPGGFHRQVLILAAKELRDAFRNRWFLLYAAIFAILTSVLSLVSMAGTGLSGMAGFGRTAAGLINVILLIVPLMALTVGAALVAGERDRGTLEYLLSHPISRLELLVGKYLGSAAALLIALTLGFGISMIVVGWHGHVRHVNSFLSLIVSTDLLALEMLAVGMLISVVCRRSSVAVGLAILVWFALVFLTDLGLMGSALAFRLQVQDLFHLSLLNPMQVFKMSVLGSIHASLDVLGPAGLYATRTYGSRLLVLFITAGVAWVILPLTGAYVLFARRSEA
jgi:Cu-processing system permease protein